MYNGAGMITILYIGSLRLDRTAELFAHVSIMQIFINLNGLKLKLRLFSNDRP